jgi:hypothetical protein
VSWPRTHYIQPYTLDLSDLEEKSADVLRLFEKAAENAPALIVLEDLDRAFPTEGKRTQERTVSFQTLLNCLDGVGSQDGVIVVATANDPTCLDPAILKRPGRFDRVVAIPKSKRRFAPPVLPAAQSHSHRRAVRNSHRADGRILFRPTPRNLHFGVSVCLRAREGRKGSRRN